MANKTPAVLELRLSGHSETQSLRCIFNTDEKLAKLEKMKCCNAVDYVLDWYANKNDTTRAIETGLRNWLASRTATYAGTMKYKQDGKGPNDIQVPPSDMEHTDIVKFLKTVKDSQMNETRYGKLVLDKDSGLGNYL